MAYTAGMKRIALFAALLAAAPSLAGEEEAKQTPRNVLDAFVKRVKEAAALKISGEAAYKITREGQVQEAKQTADARIARPLHGEISIKSPQFSADIVADGKAVYVLDHGGKTYRKIGTAWMPIFPDLFPIRAWCPDQEMHAIKGVTREEDGAIKLDLGSRTEWFWFDDKGALTKARTLESRNNITQDVTYTFKSFVPVAKADPAEYAGKLPDGYKLHDPMAQMNASLLKVGSDLPDVTVTSLDGQALKLREFKGKTLVLNFWFFH